MKSTLTILTIAVTGIGLASGSIARAQTTDRSLAAQRLLGATNSAAPNQPTTGNAQYNPYAPPRNLPAVTNNVPGFSNSLPGFGNGFRNRMPGNTNGFLNPGVTNRQPPSVNQLNPPNNNFPPKGSFQPPNSLPPPNQLPAQNQLPPPNQIPPNQQSPQPPPNQVLPNQGQGQPVPQPPVTPARPVTPRQ